MPMKTTKATKEIHNHLIADLTHGLRGRGLEVSFIGDIDVFGEVFVKIYVI